MRHLLFIPLLFFLSNPAFAWWDKYGSKAEADIASSEWAKKGGQYKETWTVKSNRRVRAKNPNSIDIPPMPKPWKPETYPWLITGERWDKVEKDCWIENMSADQRYRYCGDVLAVNKRPHPKYPKSLYNSLMIEREEAIKRSKKPYYKTESYDEERFMMVDLRMCFDEPETRQYVCKQKRGLRKGGVYTSERVNHASSEYKYFKY